jgi:trans-aconitate methyltransferase
MLSHTQRAKKYTEMYNLGVIIRDHALNDYNTFLSHLGETKTLPQLVEEVLARKKQCRVFDIGCGNGQALAELKMQFGKRVHVAGIDLIPCTSKLDEFMQGDAVEWDWPRHEDLIVSFRAAHEMGNLSKILTKILANLTPGGKAFIWVRIKENVTGKPKYLGEMTVEEEAFLQKLAAFTSYGGAKLTCKPVEGTLNGTTQSGFALIVEKPLQ